MATTFMVNGQVKGLEMHDDNGIDWAADFIGNTAHGMSRDDDGNYIATEEDYQWWKDMIAAYQEMESVIEKYKEKYGRDKVDEWLQKSAAFDVDLEDQPSSVKHELAAMDEEYAE
jgi:hypothetical protein